MTSAQRPGLAGFRNTVSLDQLIAEKIGHQTRFPFLALANSGTSLSWTRNGVNIPALNSPSKLFQALFIQGNERAIKEELAAFNDFLTDLKKGDENGSSLLDQTAVLFGSNLGNASAHDWHNLPIILAGGGYRHGKYVAHDDQNNTPLANLFVEMAQRMGVETDRFGSSTGAGVRGLDS